MKESAIILMALFGGVSVIQTGCNGFNSTNIVLKSLQFTAGH